MGVYSNNTSLGIDVNNIAEQVCHERVGIEAALAIVAESESNYNKIMQAVGVNELQYYEENGVEFVYEAADIKGFFSKIKEFFVKLLEKIKGLFTKFFAMINTWAKSDKEFVNKYKRDLSVVDTKNFKFQGYVFSNLDYDVAAGSNKAQGVANKAIGIAPGGSLENEGGLDEAIKGYEDKEKISDEMRAAFIGSGTELSAGEFAQELFKFFRSNEDSKQEIETVNVNELLTVIDGAAETKKQAEKAYKGIEKSISDSIKDVEKVEKELLKAIPNKTDANETALSSKKVRVAHIISDFLRQNGSMASIVNGAKMAAIRDLNRQSKAVCVKLLTYKPKNESSTVYHTEGGIFGNVTLK
jgi:hypothetical protein